MQVYDVKHYIQSTLMIRRLDYLADTIRNDAVKKLATSYTGPNERCYYELNIKSNRFQKYMGHQQIFAISANVLHIYSCISLPHPHVDLECELHLSHMKQPNVDTQH